MIVDDFDRMSAVVMPDESDAPLAVDPNRMLAPAIASQSLQPVARRHAKVLQALGRVERAKLAPGGGGEVLGHAARQIASEDHRSSFVAEAPDHNCTYAVRFVASRQKAG